MPPVIEVHQLFKVAVDNGNRVIEIEPGVHEVDDRIAENAVKHLQVATYKEEGKANKEIDVPPPSQDAEQPEQPEQPEQKPKDKRGAKGKVDESISNEGTSQT